MRGLSAPYGLSYTPGMWLNSIQVSKGISSVTAGHEAITGQINLEHRKPTDDERLFINFYLDDELRPELNLSTALPEPRIRNYRRSSCCTDRWILICWATWTTTATDLWICRKPAWERLQTAGFIRPTTERRCGGASSIWRKIAERSEALQGFDA